MSRTVMPIRVIYPSWWQIDCSASTDAQLLEGKSKSVFTYSPKQFKLIKYRALIRVSQVTAFPTNDYLDDITVNDNNRS